MRRDRQPTPRLHIRGGRVVDPASRTDGVLDIYVAEGLIAGLGHRPEGFEAETVIDAAGRVVAPGLVDLCARMREPGQEHKATIASETRAAARGGITTVCCPPDTDPVVDTPAVVELIRSRAEGAASTRIAVIGALTRGLGGTHLSEMGALKEAGCVGIGQGMRPIADTQVLRNALEYAATHNLTVFLQPLDFWLSQNGCVHEGEVSMRLGLPGVPESAETVALARDLVLVARWK
jgi:dihydroorotase